MAMDEPRFYHGQSDKDGKWYFHLQGKNGEVMMPSEAYETEYGALHGIEAVKRAVLEIVAAEQGEAVDEARRLAGAPLNNAEESDEKEEEQDGHADD